MKKFFYSYYLGFSPILLNEILSNSGIDSDKNSLNLTIDEIKNLDKVFLGIVKNIKNKEYCPIVIKDEFSNTKILLF